MQFFLLPRVSVRSLAWMLLLTCLAGLQVQPIAQGQIQDKSTAELVQQLDESNLDQRRDAVYELVRRRATEREVILALAELVDDRDEQIRFQALMGLARAGEQAEPAIESLLECLTNRDDQIRYRASVALGKVGIAAVPKLLEAWTKSSSQEKVGIASGLSLMGPKADDALPVLRNALQDADGRTPAFCG